MINDNDRLAELNQSFHELQALNKLALAISSTLELETIINTILKEATALTRACQGSILLTKPAATESVTTLLRFGTNQYEAMLHKISQVLAGWILRNKQPLLISNLFEDQRFKSLKDFDCPLQSVLAVPIQARGNVLGVLVLHGKENEGDFSEKDLRLLNIIASQSAHVLENASLLQQLKEENQYLKREVERKYGFEEIIGQGPAMESVFKLLEKIIPTDARILIEGESGTGKELIARAIHYNGPRKSQRFVAVDCGALPEQLLESELFGHVKGAFTGASESKKGLFQAADGGTLFLDEINNMTTSLQAKLLRAIQESEVRPVGGTQPVKVDVRIICATSQDLSQSVKQGTFREELLFRLKVVTVKLPPLRERKEDILILANHFLTNFSRSMNKPLAGFSRDATNWLLRYRWPGNVRELVNVIERCATLAEPHAKIVDVDLLPEEFQGAAHPLSVPSAEGDQTLLQAVEDLERVLVAEALKKFGGNRTKAAESLGLSRRGLLNKIERYGLSENV
jgi:Nif-specific regulatory protein